MARILVLAGPNGAGKSSIAGAFLRAHGGTYFNPDEVARSIAAVQPALAAREVNSVAWQHGVRLLERAIAERGDFNFETTLGGRTITRRLHEAIDAGVDVVIWYVALASPDLHVERVRARVAAGGHAIDEADIRARYDTSRANLIDLMPGLAALRVFDNSKHADVASGETPEPELLLDMARGVVSEHADLAAIPAWAKPIVATAFAIDPASAP
jgi:predicted ABC-type ATPase